MYECQISKLANMYREILDEEDIKGFIEDCPDITYEELRDMIEKLYSLDI